MSASRRYCSGPRERNYCKHREARSTEKFLARSYCKKTQRDIITISIDVSWNKASINARRQFCAFFPQCRFDWSSNIYCMELLENLDYTVRRCLEVENKMTSVERVISYTNLQSEPGYSVQKQPSEDWPVEGGIEVKGLRLVYYNGGPEVLKVLNLSVAPAEKIDITGRTGAGLYTICGLVQGIRYVSV